ncbi:MAG: hypothetical protein AAB289_07945, partial [Chloroflexota bacterium]
MLKLAGWLGRVGAGVIQFGGGNPGLSRTLAESTGRPVVYGGITQRAGAPNQWKKDLAYAEATSRDGVPYYPLVNPRPGERRFTLQDAQHFNSMATWKTVMSLPLEERKQAFADPAVRAKLHFEAVDTPSNPDEATDFSRRPAAPAPRGGSSRTDSGTSSCRRRTRGGSGLPSGCPAACGWCLRPCPCKTFLKRPGRTC